MQGHAVGNKGTDGISAYLSLGALSAKFMGRGMA